MDNFDNLTKLVEEIGRLKEGHKILEEIWTYSDPHSDNVTVKYNGKEIMQRLRHYFDFDDSE
jgi:hypothetical protein